MASDAGRQIVNIPQGNTGYNHEVADRIAQSARQLGVGCPKVMSGLAVRQEDCPITKTVRAALYCTSLKPTEDDVLTIVNAIKEDYPEWDLG